MEYRDRRYDCLRGILILLVVIGHSRTDTLHDIIFLFHMPLFFILSGYFLKKEKLTSKSYLKNKAVTLLVPYFVYLLLDLLFVRRDYSVSSVTRALWGGRAISGVYWYITCFLFTLFAFGFLLKYLKENTMKRIILIGGDSSN